jgi:NADPH:quinone reductase-like Zn-dependent oxidoreductase
MRAVVQERYGPVDCLRLQQVPRPEPGPGEVLVRVRATSVHADIWHAVLGRPYVMRLMGFGLLRPDHPIPGTDLAGEVVVSGPGATRFAPGERVFGESHRGMQWSHGGAFAEYAAVPEENLATIPEGVSFEQAAAVPTSGFIAWVNLIDYGRLRVGQHVLINGAAGGVGTAALQIAKARGARVTAVDAGDRLPLLRELGADAVIDYQRQDCLSTGERYDLIFDVASTLPYGRCRPALADDGLYVRIGHDHYGERGGRFFGSMPGFFALLARSRFDHHLPPVVPWPPKGDLVAALRDLLADGLLTPPIDRTLPLEEVREALRHLMSGRARGKILLLP